MRFSTAVVPAVAALLLISVLTPPLSALGSREQDEKAVSAEAYTSYLAFRSGEEGAPLFRSRFYSTPALSAFSWMHFSRTGGSVNLEGAQTAAGARLREERAIETGGYLLFPLKAEFSSTGAGSASRQQAEVLTVSFPLQPLLNEEGSVLIQPFRFALMQAVLQDSRSRGSVRLLGMQWNGDSFTAAVEIAD